MPVGERKKKNNIKMFMPETNETLAVDLALMWFKVRFFTQMELLEVSDLVSTS